MSSTVNTNDLSEFQTWARGFARGLRGDELILLSGPMGAGKTEFVKALAEELGSAEAASSPTYTFHQAYKLAKGALDHWDLYRVKNAEDLDSVAFWDLIVRAPGIVCVEWPERAEDTAWPLGRRILRVAIVPSGSARSITVAG